jgi:conjugal transfer pilus assembly protein TraF
MAFSKAWVRVFVLSAGVVAGVCFAADEAGTGFGAFEKKEEGWWWKKEPKELQIPPKPVPAKPAPVKEEPKPPAERPTYQQPAPFSTEWLRENLPKLLDRAIDDPSEENLAAYFYAQRVLMDKSQNFAEKARAVVMSDPLLDENSRVPMATFARIANMGASQEARDEALSRLASVGGLWMFYRSDCRYCEPMADALMGFEAKYKFLTTFVALDHKPLKILKEWVNDEGQAKALGVKIAPTVFFVVPPNNYFIVAQGAMSMPELGDRILLAAETHGLLKDEEIKAIYPERRGLLSGEDMKDGATTDPKELVKRLRERLRSSYEKSEPQGSK